MFGARNAHSCHLRKIGRGLFGCQDALPMVLCMSDPANCHLCSCRTSFPNSVYKNQWAVFFPSEIQEFRYEVTAPTPPLTLTHTHTHTHPSPSPPPPPKKKRASAEEKDATLLFPVYPVRQKPSCQLLGCLSSKVTMVKTNWWRD